MMLLFFSCSKFLVWDYNTSDILQCKHSWSVYGKYNYCDCWCYIIHIKQCFHILIRDCYSMCLQFVCNQSDKNHSVHGCPFLAVIFLHFFSACDDCILKSTTAWLLKLSILYIYIHSFMHIHNTTFQTKRVFNNVLFSTEVYNPLHAHLLAQSFIYVYQSFIYIWVILKTGQKRVLLSRWNKNSTKTWNFLSYCYISDVMCLEK